MCRLESGGEGFNLQNNDGTVTLEAAQKLVVLLRVADHHVMKIRIASTNCTIDAGGVHLIWLDGVKPETSVSLLEQYVRATDFENGDEQGMNGQALAAIAQHGDASADRALASFAAVQQPIELRRRTAFWLGVARGKAGLAQLQGMAKSDPSSDIRAQVTFALSVSKEPGALEEMIRMAREDESSHVRGQALFWLAQKANKKAASTITSAIENDPDTEVKKKAVFALSQMPKDEGVPKLIQVAQTNRNPEVRKQAMFWLGESHDPRALAFFEKILSQ
jgi:HEAT repeat protein